MKWKTDVTSAVAIAIAIAVTVAVFFLTFRNALGV
jgi:hypothetical protein